MTKSVDEIPVEPREKYSCSLMGDTLTGKTSLVESYGRTVEHANLLHMPDYTCLYVSNGSVQVELDVHDAPAQNDGRLLHMFSSQFADVILMVFSVAAQDSFIKIEEVFMPFARKNYPRIPVIVVANEIDLRYTGQTREWVATPEMGSDLAEKIGADGYLECSSLHGHGVRILFERAVAEAKKRKQEEAKKKARKCVLM
uniref:P-loop containing nucleoside triphosphate hydrolase protein n=1 Tax=Steinernema glaseri TaxID=37863 RepID=A0A1I7Y4G2_9BILA